MSDTARDRIAERFWSDEEVDRAVRQAVREALERHGRQGNLVAVERLGKVLLVRVEEVVDDNVSSC